MAVKWSILVPALVLVSLSGYYIATQPESPALSATLIAPVEAAVQEISLDEPAPTPTDQVEVEPELVQPAQEETPQETPAPLEEETPQEEPTPSEEVPTDEEAMPEEETPAPAEAEPPEEAEPPVEEEPAPQEEPAPGEEETVSTPQPLDSDIYNLVGNYVSDQGIAVDIQFVNGFYHISLQGMSDSHHTITERSPSDGTALDLSITLTNLPISVNLSRSQEGVLSIVAYMNGSTAPILAATATRVEG